MPCHAGLLAEGDTVGLTLFSLALLLAVFSLGGDIAGLSFSRPAASHSSLRPPAFACSFSLGSADEWFALSGLFALLCHSASKAGLLFLVVVVVVLVGLGGGPPVFLPLGGEGECEGWFSSPGG